MKRKLVKAATVVLNVLERVLQFILGVMTLAAFCIFAVVGTLWSILSDFEFDAGDGADPDDDGKTTSPDLHVVSPGEIH